ncbi:MAG: REP-associated tyrosine transposase [Sphingomonadales bacterium]|jgi:putative transposase|nr:REP-associated tyrosine transposase [Sphingomonadales bacterium]
MPRSARLVVPTVPHHLTHRGNNKQRTFFSEGDYRLYRKYLAAACEGTGTSVWAWCLMPNHVHLILVPSLESGLGAVMRRTQGRYTRAINAREGRVGHLWQARFASFVMDEPYLLACARYVELNPVRAGLAARAEDWPWSSARAHLGGGGDALTDAAPLLERWPDWRQVIEAPLDDRLVAAIRERERSGRPLGSPSFARRFAPLREGLRPRRGRPPKIGA